MSVNINNDLIRRGSIFMADLDRPIGDELGYRRPVVIIRSNELIDNSSTILVAVITGRTLRYDSEAHVEFRYTSNERPLTIMLEHLRTIDRSRLVRFCATLCDDGMEAVDAALRVVTGFKEGN